MCEGVEVRADIWISDVEDAVVEEAIRLNTDTTFPPLLKPRQNKKMWIHLNQGDNSWIESFVERHQIGSERLRAFMSVYSEDKSRTVRVPPRLVDLICHLGVRVVEFYFDAIPLPPDEDDQG